MRSIYNLTLKEMQEQFKPKFRAKQMYGWLYNNYVESFEDMANIPKTLREELKNDYTINPLKIVKKECSSDGTIKYLFSLYDEHTIETVLIRMRDKLKDEEGNIVAGEKYTICVSSQVGCKMGCTFCYTAKGGFVRNLFASEIVAQVVAIKRDNNLAPEKRLNIVFMGMGEPLDNLENVSKAIRVVSEENGLSISTKRQTVSTSGLSQKIHMLGSLDLGVNLAISLHAVDDSMRSRLMPINRKYNIASVIDAVRNFPYDARKRVMFEYLVIKDFNDDIASAKKLLSLLDGIKSKVNLIYFNPHKGSKYQRPLKEDVVKFQEYLTKKGLLCTIRESKGIDISAACGQLKEKQKEEPEEKEHV